MATDDDSSDAADAIKIKTLPEQGFIILKQIELILRTIIHGI